jgi:hypothetical protein
VRSLPGQLTEFLNRSSGVDDKTKEACHLIERAADIFEKRYTHCDPP